MIQRGKKKNELKEIRTVSETSGTIQIRIIVPNIRIRGVPEEEDKKKDHEKILEEIIVENFPKMEKEIITQGQETQSRKQDKPKAKHPRDILLKLTKIKHKEQILKAAREKQQITHKGIPIRITVDHSIETLQARREW